MLYNFDMATKRMSSAPLRALAEKRGIDNPYALAAAAGVSYPTARVWWFDDEMARIDVPTLVKFADFFKVNWCELLELVEDPVD